MQLKKKRIVNTFYKTIIIYSLYILFTYILSCFYLAQDFYCRIRADGAIRKYPIGRVTEDSLRH